MASRIVVQSIYVCCPYLKQEKPLAACYLNSQDADHYCYGCEMPEEWRVKYGLRTYKRTLLQRECEAELPTETTWLYAPRDTQGDKWMVINTATGERYPAGSKPAGDPTCDVCQLSYFQAHGGCTKHSIKLSQAFSAMPITTEPLRAKARKQAVARADDRYGRVPTSATTPAPDIAAELAREAKRLSSKASKRRPKQRKKGGR